MYVFGSAGICLNVYTVIMYIIKNPALIALPPNKSN